MAFVGCPALKISDLSRAIYEIHSLSHSVEGSFYRRHISFDKIKEMPSIVAEGFDVIADEAHTILREQAEKNGGSKTET